MFNKNSFDLTKNEETKTKKSEKLYQPKKFRWCKFIVIPVLIGFILLLILTNIDFTGNAYNQTRLENDTKNFKNDEKIISDLSPTNSTQSRNALDCTEISNDYCSVSCYDGNINNIYQMLEPLYQQCGHDMILTLTNCKFPSGTLKSDYFEGDYRLQQLNIIDSELNAIETNAFKQQSVMYLQNLTLINTQFEILGNTTFEGLQQLNYFYMINQAVAGDTFKGNEILRPLALTLLQAVIQQQSEDDTGVGSGGVVGGYDPTDWFRGAEMTKLHSLNLSNNNFQNLLNNQTFSIFVMLRDIYLSNCRINYLPTNVFDNIVKSLEYIDLRDNQLTTLAGEFLITLNSINLNLTNNYWDCSCNNSEMLQIIQNTEMSKNILYKDDIKCYTPLNVSGIEMEKLDLECFIETTISTTETSKTTDANITISTSTTDMETSGVTGEQTTITTTEMETTISSEETTESSYETTDASTEKPTSVETTFTSTTTTVEPTFTPITTPTTPTGKPDLIDITCQKPDNPYYGLLVRQKCSFSIQPISGTSIQIVIILPCSLTNVEILYFINSTTSKRQKLILSITDLVPNMAYVFCLIERDTVQNISPFDCKSYAAVDAIPQPWILNGDKPWIVSIVVLVTSLMLFLGIILVILLIRSKNRHKNRVENGANSNAQISTTPSSSNNSNVNSVPLRTMRDSHMRMNSLYQIQYQPPDAIAVENDLCLYEDITF